MPVIYFILLALVPSFLWLSFFLKEDKKPEPKKMILRVFLLGTLSTIPVIFVGYLFVSLMNFLNVSVFLTVVLSVVLVAAVTEEIIKYLVVKYSVLNNSECDEPTDLIIYSITAAMGFAALENIIFIFPGKEFFLNDIFGTNPVFYLKAFLTESAVRFISGTFLHALTSGLMGYFIALSIMKTNKSKKVILTGLFLAISLHALYNFSIIMTSINDLYFLVAPIILITLLFVVLFCFKKAKQMPSICEIKK